MIYWNLNKHGHISTNSELCIYIWWARDSHMHGASFWTRDDEMFAYVGVPWPYMATRQVKQSIALAYDVWRLLSLFFNLACHGLRNRPHTSYSHEILWFHWLPVEKQSITCHRRFAIQFLSETWHALMIRSGNISKDLSWSQIKYMQIIVIFVLTRSVSLGGSMSK